MKANWLGRVRYDVGDVVYFGRCKYIVESTQGSKFSSVQMIKIRSENRLSEAYISSHYAKPVIRTRKCLKSVRTWEGLLNKLNERDYFDD